MHTKHAMAATRGRPQAIEMIVENAASNAPSSIGGHGQDALNQKKNTGDTTEEPG